MIWAIEWTLQNTSVEIVTTEEKYYDFHKPLLSLSVNLSREWPGLRRHDYDLLIEYEMVLNSQRLTSLGDLSECYKSKAL